MHIFLNYKSMYSQSHVVNQIIELLTYCVSKFQHMLVYVIGRVTCKGMDE